MVAICIPHRFTIFYVKFVGAVFFSGEWRRGDGQLPRLENVSFAYSWLATNQLGITRQCCLPTMPGAHNRIDKIFFCVSPPTSSTCKSRMLSCKQMLSLSCELHVETRKEVIVLQVEVNTCFSTSLIRASEWLYLWQFNFKITLQVSVVQVKVFMIDNSTLMFDIFCQ